MRALIVSFFLIFFSFSASTQNIKVLGGLNVSNVRAINNDTLLSDGFFNRKVGHFGASVEFQIKKNFYLESGFIYSSKGYENNESIRNYRSISVVNYSYKFIYVDIPLLITYKIKVHHQADLFFTAGTYFGKIVDTEIRTTGSAVPNISVGNKKENDIKPWDRGMLLGFGLETHPIRFGVNFDIGLRDISPNNENGLRMSNRVVRFTLACKLFDFKKEKE